MEKIMCGLPSIKYLLPPVTKAYSKAKGVFNFGTLAQNLIKCMPNWPVQAFILPYI